ncbi:DUF3080 domain-containing protein [Marinobacter sp. CAU 1620]|nr:DUF3080 domain-containing protein [Marinobacter arenosus]
MMDEYVERVARVLDSEPELTAIEPPSQIPRRRNRVLTMPELDMGMLDFLSLYGCELQFVVGEKNSVMGKVMQPLNRLRYELRFIEAAQDCLPETEDEDLVEALQEAIDSKRESLPIAIWNATWGVEEVETLFTLAKGYYPVSPEGNPVSDLALDAEELNQTVAALRSGTLEVSLEFAGSVQQRWQAEYRAGQLLNSAALLKSRLDDATALIQRRIGGRPLCLNGKPNNQSEIVQGMFFSVYIEKIQPYMSGVGRARMALIEPLAALAEEQRSVMPPAFEVWYRRHLSQDSERSLWRELDEAMSRHTKAWQTLLEQCGLRPGA